MSTQSWLAFVCALCFGLACSRDKTRADAPANAPADAPPRTPPVATGSPHDWVITPRGLGPLHAGMTRAAAEAVVGGSLAIDGDSAWNHCDYTTSERLGQGIRVMVEDGTIARIEVVSGPTATAAGARIGDSEARIRLLYPGRVVTTPHKYTDGHYLTVMPATAAESQFRIIFETDSLRVTRYRAGRLPPVAYVEGCG
jgi:hypothetical protein